MSDTGDMLRILGRHVGSYEDWDKVDSTSNVFYGVKLLPKYGGNEPCNLIFDHLTGEIVLENTFAGEFARFDAVKWLAAADAAPVFPSWSLQQPSEPR